MTSNEDKILADWKVEAATLGEAAGKAAASWVLNGNLSVEDYQRTLDMLDQGDDIPDFVLPARPDLSGEWADAMSPRKLYEEVTGRDAHGDSSWNADSYQEVLEVLCKAWEEASDAAYDAEVERLLREAVAPDVSCQHCGATIVRAHDDVWVASGRRACAGSLRGHEATS